MKPRRYDFNPTDWTEALAGLGIGAAAVGCYVQTVAFCLARRKPTYEREALIERLAKYFGDDPRTIRAAVARLEKHEKLVDQGDGELEPNRVREEIERAWTRIQRNRENGPKGGRPPRERQPIAEQDVDFSKGSETDMVSGKEPYQPSNINQQTSSSNQQTLSAGALDREFDAFWAVYPRHEAKKAARASYQRARKTGSAEAILAGAQRYRDDPNRADQFTKHPTTWLNQGCWTDDPLPTRTPPNGNRPDPAVQRHGDHAAIARAFDFGVEGRRPGVPADPD